MCYKHDAPTELFPVLGLSLNSESDECKTVLTVSIEAVETAFGFLLGSIHTDESVC
jgi:hypothetical protein